MPTYEVHVERIYVVRTRERASRAFAARSAREAEEAAASMGYLTREESGIDWEILKGKDAVKAVQVCHVKRIHNEPAERPPLLRRLRVALGL